MLFLLVLFIISSMGLYSVFSPEIATIIVVSAVVLVGGYMLIAEYGSDIARYCRRAKVKISRRLRAKASGDDRHSPHSLPASWNRETCTPAPETSMCAEEQPDWSAQGTASGGLEIVTQIPQEILNLDDQVISGVRLTHKNASIFVVTRRRSDL